MNLLGAQMIKNMIFASMGVAGTIALLSIIDLVFKAPFGGYSMLLDISFLISSAIMGYLGCDAYRDNC